MGLLKGGRGAAMRGDVDKGDQRGGYRVGVTHQEGLRDKRGWYLPGEEGEAQGGQPPLGVGMEDI